MTKEKKQKKLRYLEYYDLQECFDDMYAKSTLSVQRFYSYPYAEKCAFYLEAMSLQIGFP